MASQQQSGCERRGMLSFIEAMLGSLRAEARRSGTLIHVDAGVSAVPALNAAQAALLEASLLDVVRSSRNAEIVIRLDDTGQSACLSLIVTQPDESGCSARRAAGLRAFAGAVGGTHHETQVAATWAEMVELPRGTMAPGEDRAQAQPAEACGGAGLSGLRIGILCRATALTTSLPEMLRARGAEVLEFPCARDSAQTLVQRLSGFDLVICDDAKLAGQFGYLIDDFGLLTRSIFVSRGLCTSDVEEVNAEHWSFPMMPGEVFSRADGLSQARGWRKESVEATPSVLQGVHGQPPMVCIVDSNLGRRARLVGRAMTAGILCMSCSSRKALRNLLKLWRFNAVLVGGESASEVAEMARVARDVASHGSLKVLAVDGSGPREVIENPVRFGLNGTISADRLDLIQRQAV